jgi:hypothetical protein
MYNKPKHSGNYGVVGVVTAILLLGLIVAIISLIQTVYVPKIMEHRESEHLDHVADQFTRLKSAIDNQVSSQTQDVPVATSLTLGSKELPYLLTVRAFGTIEIIPGLFSFGLTYDSGGGNDQTLARSVGILKYSSANGYYLDQSYIYESGAVIVSQDLGNMMLIRPSFSVSQTGTNVTVLFDLVNITAIGEKMQASGFGTYPIQTEFDTFTSLNISDVKSFYILTDFPNAWRLYIEDGFSKAGLLKDVDYSSSIIENGLLFDLTINDSLSSFFSLRIININTQIGPGWVE